LKTPLIPVRKASVAKRAGIREREKKIKFLEMHKKGLCSAFSEYQTVFSSVTTFFCTLGRVPVKREWSSTLEQSG